MQSKTFLPLLLIFFAVSVWAQKEKPAFPEKKNQNSFNFQPISASYTYAHKFNPNLTLGTRMQFGLGIQFMLAGSTFLFDFGYGEGPEKVRPFGGSFEILKLQFFYRHPISKRFYYDVGPVASWVTGEAEWQNPFNAGIEAAVYYSIWIIDVGFRIKGIISFDPIRYHTRYFALIATPITIGFSF